LKDNLGNELQRIYCVVAKTVQHPLDSLAALRAGEKFLGRRGRTDETRDIIQPPGRLAAQAGHAIGMAHEYLARKAVLTEIEQRILSGICFYPHNPQPYLRKEFIDKILHEVCLAHRHEFFTTIILGARDSFELGHVRYLLQKNDIMTFCFPDQNDDYGPGEVITAIATMPVDQADVEGILDYLPGWEP